MSSWRFPLGELRKLHPLCRTAASWDVGWELWLQSRNGTSTSHVTMIYPNLLRRLVESVKRLSSGVQGQIGANEICTKARVARLVECCLKQKMGYGRHANLIWQRTRWSLPTIFEDKQQLFEASNEAITKNLRMETASTKKRWIFTHKCMFLFNDEVY